MQRLPNFFIVGAPKAGTTSLYRYLDQHPEIYMSAIKEPHYFADEIRAENCDPMLRRRMAHDDAALQQFLSGAMREKRFGGIVSDWETYLRLFSNAGPETALGEASVCYLWSPTAPARIADTIPDAKIVVMLRDPADRAFSQYVHGVADGVIRWSFREHIERNLRHRSSELCLCYPFVEFGLYASQLRRYLECFATNVWVGFYEDFKLRPLDTLQSIFGFLGVDPQFSPEMATHHLEAHLPRNAAIGRLKRWRFARAAATLVPSSFRPLMRRVIRKPEAPRMSSEDRKYLLDFYREDIRNLANLVNRDLDAWLTVNQPDLPGDCSASQ
jgi:hypothetical protein